MQSRNHVGRRADLLGKVRDREHHPQVYGFGRGGR